MSNCKQCGAEIDVNTGRRPKKYCNEVCKSAYWRKNKPKEPKYVLKSTFQEVVKERDKYKELFLNGHIVTETGRIVDNSQKSADSEQKQETGLNEPKNLQELKKLMPEGLDSEGRSEWTRINRVKYGI